LVDCLSEQTSNFAIFVSCKIALGHFFEVVVVVVLWLYDYYVCTYLCTFVPVQFLVPFFLITWYLHHCRLYQWRVDICDMITHNCKCKKCELVLVRHYVVYRTWSQPSMDAQWMGLGSESICPLTSDWGDIIIWSQLDIRVAHSLIIERTRTHRVRLAPRTGTHTPLYLKPEGLERTITIPWATYKGPKTSWLREASWRC